MNNVTAVAKRVLIVEDEPDIVDVVSGILQDAGYTTLAAVNGEEGLRLAKEEQPDLVLLDIRLPGIDGIEVCRRLSAERETRGIPVVILTGRDELATKLSSFVAGARRFIKKPFDGQDLVSEVERTLRSKLPYGPETPFDPRD